MHLLDWKQITQDRESLLNYKFWIELWDSKKGIHKCVECEKKKKENPDDAGMCSKCGAAETRLEKTIYKELLGEGSFP